jgi:hypothetical protein
MKQALDALTEHGAPYLRHGVDWDNAITALRAAIEAQERCEPVGYARYEKDKLVLMVRNTVSMDMFPIYTHPAPAEKCEHVPVTTFGGNYCIKCDAPIESNDHPVPAGWQLVPVEPTDAMIRASHDLASIATYSNGQHTHIPIAYKAMLQAAPKGELK